MPGTFETLSQPTLIRKSGTRLLWKDRPSVPPLEAPESGAGGSCLPRPRNVPRERMNAPQERMNAPQERMNAPQERMNAPQERMNAPQGRMNAPRERMNTPR